MRYLICGSRDWSDWASVEGFVRALRPGDEVAHGDAARGADRMVHYLLTDQRSRVRRARRVHVHGAGGAVGTRRGEGTSRGDVDVHCYPADWVRYAPVGPGSEEKANPAGFIRNEQMVKHFAPDACVYFSVDGLAGPSGTRHCVETVQRLCPAALVFEVQDFIMAQRGEPR